MRRIQHAARVHGPVSWATCNAVQHVAATDYNARASAVCADASRAPMLSFQMYASSVPAKLEVRACVYACVCMSVRVHACARAKLLSDGQDSRGTGNRRACAHSAVGFGIESHIRDLASIPCGMGSIPRQAWIACRAAWARWSRSTSRTWQRVERSSSCLRTTRSLSVCKDAHACAHARVRTHACMHACTHACADIRACVHACTHTHQLSAMA